MSSEYTPTTEAVKEQYTKEQPPQIGTVSEKAAEFDRWHAAELRAAKAEAWDEAIGEAAEQGTIQIPDNPYRADRIEEGT